MFARDPPSSADVMDRQTMSGDTGERFDCVKFALGSLRFRLHTVYSNLEQLIESERLRTTAQWLAYVKLYCFSTKRYYLAKTLPDGL